MHATLGFAVSELMNRERDRPGLVIHTMAHWLQAISMADDLQWLLLSSSLASDRRFTEEGNALTLQSVRLDDGMVEFMAFCRGTVLVDAQMHCRGGGSSSGSGSSSSTFIFRNWLGEAQRDLRQPFSESFLPGPLFLWRTLRFGLGDHKTQELRGLLQ